jgi:hypothetical protein
VIQNREGYNTIGYIPHPLKAQTSIRYTRAAVS